MKILSLILAFSFASLSFGILPSGEAETSIAKATQEEGDFCKKLTQILDAAEGGFTSIKGEETTRTISGVKKKFYLSNVSAVKKGFVNDSELYPEYTEIFVTNPVKGEVPDPKLVEQYESYKNKVTQCLEGQGWRLMQKDKSNSIYLEDTNFKKLVGIKKLDGPGTIKFELFMYNNRIREVASWCIELTVEGVGSN